MRARIAMVTCAATAVIGCAGCSGSPARPQAHRAPASATASAGTAAPAGALSSPGCSTATASSPRLSRVRTAMVTDPGTSPYGVVVTPGGRWAFVSLNTSIAVLRIGSALAPVQVRTISVPAGPLGETLTPDGRYLLAASGSGAVVNVAAARAGRPAVMGVIPAGLFPREMALEPGGQTLLVTNYASGQLEAVSVATLPAT